MKKTLHSIFSFIAFLTILLFFTSSLAVELFGSHETIAQVKHLIVFGLYIFIPIIALTGITGFLLSKSRTGQLVEAKKKRMPLIAANGILILLPAVIFLDKWASAGLFDTRFYIVQGLEFMAGGTNLFLMGLSLRDGLRLTGSIKIEKIS